MGETAKSVVRCACVVAVVLLATGLSVPTEAQDWAPLQVALLNPIQAIPDNWDIYGLRLNLIYGQNYNVHGLDLGIANCATNRSAGIQGGLAFSISEYLAGLQFAFVSGAVQMRGVQVGAVNYSTDAKGLQLGLFNYTKKTKGVQVGVINIIDEGPLRFFPIINMCF